MSPDRRVRPPLGVRPNTSVAGARINISKSGSRHGFVGSHRLILNLAFTGRTTRIRATIAPRRRKLDSFECQKRIHVQYVPVGGSCVKSS